MPKTSIRTLALQHFSLVIVPVLALTFFSLFFLFNQFYEKQQQDHQHKANLMVENISQLISFYDEIVHDLAKQPKVIELIKNNDTENARLWSVQTRSLLPYSNGLALLTNDNQIIGDSKQQKIGALCIRDLLLRSEGKLKVIPPIHHPEGKTSHYDIVQPVYQNEIVIGVIFASFSLEIIQQLTNRLQQDSTYLFIETEQLVRIAEAGNPNLENNKFTTKIPKTNWILHSEIPKIQIKSFLIAYIPIAIILFFIISVVNSLLVARVGKVFIHDITGIKESLVSIHEGKRLNRDQTEPQLKETYEIVDQISELANKIYTYQQKLMTLSFKDELTNINNRRTLFNEYKKYQAMIKRGQICTLIIFDLDNFKFCNDALGHNFGDEVLKAFAKILQENIRGYDCCARLGGDEFIAIISDCTQQEIEQKYQNIQHELAVMNALWQEKSAKLLLVNISAGAVVMSNAYTNIELEIENADKALYAAKNAGRGRLCFYSEGLGSIKS
ncbi:MAG: diguanylate cyclase [Methyloprofundus sp.]|nr:diguanylate cyclase [Methyloprofundus sp.]